MKQREAAVEKVTDAIAVVTLRTSNIISIHISLFSSLLSFIHRIQGKILESYPTSAFLLVYYTPYIISTYTVCYLSTYSPGKIRPGVCVAPLTRSSCWWRWLRFWVPALCSGAPPCGLCLYRRSSLCFRVVSQLQTLLSTIV